MQIDINDKYLIKTDPYNFVVMKKMENKEGKKYLQEVSYHGELSSAVKSLIKRKILRSDAHTLNGIIDDLNNIIDEITKALEPEFEVRRIEK